MWDSIVGSSTPSGDAFLKIVNATTGTGPTVEAYYLDRAKDKYKNKFTLDKGLYCTCWDDNIIFEVNSAGDDISVRLITHFFEVIKREINDSRGGQNEKHEYSGWLCHWIIVSTPGAFESF